MRTRSCARDTPLSLSWIGTRRPISNFPGEAGTVDDRSTVADSPSSAVSSLSKSKRNMIRTPEVGRTEKAPKPKAPKPPSRALHVKKIYLRPLSKISVETKRKIA
eukprot:scaffold564_cov101-Isochrysis_galbana.AAC.8